MNWTKFAAIVAFCVVAALSINCNAINGDCDRAVGVAAARASLSTNWPGLTSRRPAASAI